MNDQEDKGSGPPIRPEGSGLLAPRHPPETADEAEGATDRDRALQEDRPPHHDER